MYESIKFHLFWGKYPEREEVVKAPKVTRDGATAISPTIKIGMRDDADLYLDDLRIEGEYLEVLLLDDGPYLINQMENNDTLRLNGKRALKMCKLEMGDTITVSKSRLLVKDLVVQHDSSASGNPADLELGRQLEQEARELFKAHEWRLSRRYGQEEEDQQMKSILVALGILGGCLLFALLFWFFLG
ncbi:MAG: hypothetical protein GY854_04655 [Deltaproteobacteria bacterium]|nr:hypothetical protein [Deltaproteobacteria bacterium]